LSVGAAVRMRGIYVGDVTDVHMEYDAATKLMSVPVTFEIEPQRITILHSNTSVAGFVHRSYAAFKDFVEHGLRAQLASSNLLTGQKIIALDFFPDAPEASMIESAPYPEIPTIEPDDLDSIMHSAKNLMGTLRATATALDQLVTSPLVKRSLVSLNRSLANVDRLTHDASAQVGPLLTSLRTASKSADQTLRQATSTLVVTKDALGNEGDGSGDLAGTLTEFKQAARSLRTLANYLESHPESLIRGKTAGTTQ
jgi:paraquat-inducible protein B